MTAPDPLASVPDPDLLARWLTALRSGDYAQGPRRLRGTDGCGGDLFCCLGVLCDVDTETEWEPAVGGWAVSGSWSMPPEHLLVAVGLNHGDAILLSRLNDDGVPFDTSAERVEGMVRDNASRAGCLRDTELEARS